MLGMRGRMKMAEYGLLCSKLRIEGLGVVADVIEKLQKERAALTEENSRLLVERDAAVAQLNEFAPCQHCAHHPNQYAENCELDAHSCRECSQSGCACKDCNEGDKWQWSGAETAAAAESAPDDPRVAQFLRDSYK